MGFALVVLFREKLELLDGQQKREARFMAERCQRSACIHLPAPSGDNLN